MSSHFHCVGGPLHRQYVPARGKKISSPDGGAYYLVGVGLRDAGRELNRQEYYVHDGIYSDRRLKHRLTAEVFFRMTWQAPSQPGLYWVRWKHRMRHLTIVDNGVESPGRIRLRVGEMPEAALHRHAMWSLEPIPDQALQLSKKDPQLGNLIAADWCGENNYPDHADNFRELARQS